MAPDDRHGWIPAHHATGVMSGMTEAGGFGFGLDFTDYRPVLRSLGEGGSLITVFYPHTPLLPYHHTGLTPRYSFPEVALRR